MTDHTSKNQVARKAVIKMVRSGLASPVEAAKVSGISSQLVAYWIRDIDWRLARQDVLGRAWKRFTALGSRDSGRSAKPPHGTPEGRGCLRQRITTRRRPAEVP